MQQDGAAQFGRATRHKDVFQCAIGALGFYLLFRFDGTGEFNEVPDFTENKAWFDKKLLVELGKDPNKQMKQRTYMNAVKDIFKELGICAKHLAHWGRVTAPVYMEFKELPETVVKMLGKFFFVCLMLFV